MEVKYPLLSKVLDPLAENPDWMNLLEAIITISSKGIRQYLCSNLVPEIVRIPVVTTPVVDGGEAESIFDIIYSGGYATYFSSVEIDGGTSSSIYKLSCKNKLLSGTFEVMSEGVLFSTGKKIEVIDGEINLISPSGYKYITIRRVSGFTDVSIPKSLIGSSINKCSFRNAVYGSYLLGTLVRDLKFQFSGGANFWAYKTKITSLGNGIYYSDFQFLPKLGDIRDIIYCYALDFMPSIYVKSIHGKCFRSENNITLPEGEYEVLVHRRMGEYKPGFIQDYTVPEEVSEDFPFTLLAKNNDYRFSVVPVQLTFVNAIRNTISLVVLGTDQWAVTRVSEGLTLSQMEGLGPTVIGVEVAENETGEQRELFIGFQPVHGEEITVRLIQAAEEFGVTFSWTNDEYFPITGSTENIRVASNLPWFITVSESWVEIATMSGDENSASEGLDIEVKIKAPELPYTSMDTARSTEVRVEDSLGKYGPITRKIHQALNPIFSYTTPPEVIQSSSMVLSVTINSNFEYRLTGEISGSFTVEDMKSGLSRTWNKNIGPNISGVSKQLEYNLISSAIPGGSKKFTIEQLGSQKLPDSLIITIARRSSGGEIEYKVSAVAFGTGMEKWELKFPGNADAFEHTIGGVWVSGDSYLNSEVEFTNSEMYRWIGVSTLDQFDRNFTTETIQFINELDSNNVMSELVNNDAVTIEFEAL